MIHVQKYHQNGCGLLETFLSTKFSKIKKSRRNHKKSKASKSPFPPKKLTKI